MTDERSPTDTVISDWTGFVGGNTSGRGCPLAGVLGHRSSGAWSARIAGVASRPLPVSLPVTDRVEAALLLACGSGVQTLPTFREPADDPLAVLHRVGVVVLELCVDTQHLQADASDAGQHPAVRRRVRAHRCVACLRLQVGELRGKDLDLALRLVDD